MAWLGGPPPRLGRCGSKSRCDFPGEEILLDSLLALLFEEPCPLVAHTDSHHIIPRLIPQARVNRDRTLPQQRNRLYLIIEQAF